MVEVPDTKLPTSCTDKIDPGVLVPIPKFPADERNTEDVAESVVPVTL
jgi:hypothetical protein